MTYIFHVWGVVAPVFLIIVSLVRILLMVRPWLQVSSMLLRINNDDGKGLEGVYWRKLYLILLPLKTVFFLDFAALIVIVSSLVVSLTYALHPKESFPGFLISSPVSMAYSIGAILSLALFLSTNRRFKILEKVIIGEAKLAECSLFRVSIEEKGV